MAKINLIKREYSGRDWREFLRREDNYIALRGGSLQTQKNLVAVSWGKQRLLDLDMVEIWFNQRVSFHNSEMS